MNATPQTDRLVPQRRRMPRKEFDLHMRLFKHWNRQVVHMMRVSGCSRKQILDMMYQDLECS